jgi:hypothetical protein
LLQGMVAAAVAANEAGKPGGGGGTTKEFEIAGVGVGDPAAGLAAAAEELARMFPALGQLSNIIPRDTLAHRLSILAEGCAVVNASGALEATKTRTLAVVELYILNSVDP